MAGNLLVAEILHRERGREHWSVDDLGYKYRSSLLKAPAQGGGGMEMPSRSPETVVLAALLRLEQSDLVTVQQRMDGFVTHRRQTQPPGASMGSMFKNPPGDYAGRLIEAAGLKGTRVGGAEISSLHANFFINLGGASAWDIYRLIQLARQKVAEKFGLELDLEIELVGDWDVPGNN
jgi:UDP-N-acetylmuramate dehydrogenase